MVNATREIITVVSTVVGVLATGIPLLIAFARKTKKFVKERNWNRLMETLPSLIIEAEQFANYTGPEKKEYVKTRLVMYSVKNKIMFDEYKFDGTIDDIVKLTKEVNKRDKDKNVKQSVLPLISN